MLILVAYFFKLEIDMLSIQKILVPTDFSDNSYSIFPLVLKTAKKFGATVDLIHIIPDSPYFKVARDTLSGLFGSGGKNPSTKELKTHLKNKLETTLNYQIPEEHRGEAFIYEGGRAEAEIVKHTHQHSYDLIMVASRGMGNSLFSRGSITEGLIQFSDIPVLSSNQDLDSQIPTIIFPTDGSKLSFEALPIALKFAEKFEATIHLLGIVVVERMDATLTGKGARIQDYALNQFRQDVLKNLKEFVKENNDDLDFEIPPSVENPSFKLRLKDEKSIPVSLHFKEGVSAYSSIVAYSLSYGQLVVMTTHGRSGLAHFFIGSTAEKVARNLEMPVITVKPKNLK